MTVLLFCDPGNINRRVRLGRSLTGSPETNMSFIQREHLVTVHGTPCTLIVYQRSKSVWIAVGYYMDERIETKDSRESTAIRRWIEAAKFKGNL
jgi:hypothetical protein